MHPADGSKLQPGVGGANRVRVAWDAQAVHGQRSDATLPGLPAFACMRVPALGMSFISVLLLGMS